MEAATRKLQPSPLLDSTTKEDGMRCWREAGRCRRATAGDWLAEWLALVEEGAGSGALDVEGQKVLFLTMLPSLAQPRIIYQTQILSTATSDNYASVCRAQLPKETQVHMQPTLFWVIFNLNTYPVF